MGTSQQKPGADYSYLGSIRAVTLEADLPKWAVVWVASRAGLRRGVKKALATNIANGARAPLYVTTGSAAVIGDSVIIVDRALVTDRNLDGTFNNIAELSGGVLGDPVYLADAGGITLSLAAATVDRAIGVVVDETCWEFGPIAGVV